MQSGSLQSARRAWRALMVTTVLVAAGTAQAHELPEGRGGRETILATGMAVTPMAAPGSTFETLNPNLPALPDFTVDHAAAAAVSPDGTTLLVLTSGFNRNFGADGKPIKDLSNEYVFVYDVTGPRPAKIQVVPVPNTFYGIDWLPDGKGFVVSGGKDDRLLRYARNDKRFAAAGAPIALGHTAGLGIEVEPMAAGVAVSPDGGRALVANYQNESVSLIDLKTGTVVAEQDLRPGKIDPAKAGVPGGSYPFAVRWATNSKAYVTSERDRELLTLRIEGQRIEVARRLPVPGQPTFLLTDKGRTRLFVTLDNSDRILALDTADDKTLASFQVNAPTAVFLNGAGLKGSNPNGMVLSPDGKTLFVSEGGLNAVAVVALGTDVLGDPANPAAADGDGDGGGDRASVPTQPSRVVGLIPTGWYPTAVAVRPDGRQLWITNGKSNAGPNSGGCRDVLTSNEAALGPCTARDVYVWQLEKAGLEVVPTPTPDMLAKLTWQVAVNDRLPSAAEHGRNAELMEFLRSRIKHVIYMVKENRSYDQLLGDLEIGDGDPTLTLLGQTITPNHHELARRFVTFDNFYDSGESSNTGWNWSTAARTTDFTERTSPVGYADRGLQYDWEGTNREINVALPTIEARKAANPAIPDDPDIMAGTADVAAPESVQGEAGAGYLWDAALRAGLTLRNYGFYGDLSRYSRKHPQRIPPLHDPAGKGLTVFFPTKAALAPVSDPYFRGFDQTFADYWRFKEWEREFDQAVTRNELPRLTLLRLNHDHMGDFDQAEDGVTTVETQMADNDYAVGLVLQKLAASPFAKDTLVFIIEDDAQDGADHVDPHRSLAYIIGPYVKRKAVVSDHLTTVNMIKTIEEVLGLGPLGLNDGLAEPMAAAFDPSQAAWDYTPIVPEPATKDRAAAALAFGPGQGRDAS